MSLSLTAEQKELLKIFKVEEQYVIPAYQRPYSWGYDECFQLYNDLYKAFQANEDYFIGNIIIAKSDNNKGILEVIDGQQRLTSLLLLIKSLHLLQPELKVLKEILEQPDWEGNSPIPRIRSDIFEAKDGQDLNSILAYTLNTIESRLEECKDRKGNYNERNAKNRFEANLLYFYDWLVFLKNKSDSLREFNKFLLRSVYLLPIELLGKTQDEANEKALIIFETINNRGMNLEDADIFKAKLYKKAKKLNQESIFVESWADFKNSCENLNLEIDDIFRYYSHIIRGREGITSSEINLREFFIRESYSPFEIKKYDEILNDLFKIIEILEFINSERNKSTELAKWFQLIEVYTNRYPKFAVVTFLYINDTIINDKLIKFLKRIIRYTYFQGSTSRVKFEIYSIIKKISLNQGIKNYYEELRIDYFDHLGRLKYGYALLAFYIDHNVAINNFNIDKIIHLNDQNHLSKDWEHVNLESIIDSLGNYIVLDIPKRKLPFQKKIDYYSSSKLKSVQNVSKMDFSYEKFRERDFLMKKKLMIFFKGTEE